MRNKCQKNGRILSCVNMQLCTVFRIVWMNVSHCWTLCSSIFHNQIAYLYGMHTAYKVTRGKIPINLCDKTNEQTCRREKKPTSKTNQTKRNTNRWNLYFMIEPILCYISAGVIYDNQKLKPKLNCEKPAQCIFPRGFTVVCICRQRNSHSTNGTKTKTKQ